MALADVAQLIVRLTLKDETSASAKTATNSLKTLGKAAFVAAGTAGFAALTKGAMDAERAQGEFMAATGKSREEAKAFVNDMNDLAGTSGAIGRSFDEITEAGTAVEQQFGTTGDVTRDLTDDILKFSKVTGQDATGATMQLEDTLSAFGLEASDAAGFMDQLVASNQKFGTDAGPEALSVLQSMAPALQAMGMEIGDGVELLNAFEVAGLDAGSAQRGLQSAIADLKPGQNLDDLIAEIGAIEDPTKRAQRAIEIFGTKAGAALAAVIKPGMRSLDDFGISAKEAAGKTDAAADAMLTTSDRIRGFFDKLGAGVRDVGQEFGPVLTSMGAMTTMLVPLTGKVSALTTALWAKVAALKAAQGGWTGVVKSATPAIGVFGAVAAGLIGVNEGLNISAEGARKFTGMVEKMSDAERQATADTQVMGFRVGNVADGFATFTNTLFGWHQVARDAAGAAAALNGRLYDQAAALKAADRAAEGLRDNFMSHNWGGGGGGGGGNRDPRVGWGSGGGGGRNRGGGSGIGNKIPRLPTFHSGGAVEPGDMGIWKPNEEVFIADRPGRIAPVGRGRGAIAPIVNVLITARDVDYAQTHRKVLQGNRAFA